MGQIEDLRLFVLIVDNGSISRAADSVNIAKSAVSRRLSLLEERFDTRLIDRGPGTWEVTKAGQELYQRAVRAIEEIDDIEADFVSAPSGLAGPLTVSIPRDFGLGYLSGPLTDFKAQYPEIALTIDLDDRIVDLSRENYDFAVRITGEDQESMSAYQIGTMAHALYASPSYVKACGNPENIDALRNHSLLHYGSERRTECELMLEDGSIQIVKFQPFLNSNSGLFLLDAALADLGIGLFPDFIANKALREGKLIKVLPEAKVAAWGIYLLPAENRRFNTRMRLFADAIKEACLEKRK